MKKRVVFLFFTLALTMAKAQFYEVGAKAGYNLNTFNDEITAKFAHGLHVGGYINYQFSFYEEFYAQSGLFLTNKGSKLEKIGPGTLTSPDYTRNYSYSAWYLQVPVLAGLHYTLSPTRSLHFLAGPAVNIGIFGKTKVETFGATHWIFEEGDGTHPTFDFLNRLDVSAILSVGMQFENYTLNLSYDYGFLPVKKEKNTEKTATNGTLMLSIGYAFPINE